MSLSSNMGIFTGSSLPTTRARWALEGASQHNTTLGLREMIAKHGKCRPPIAQVGWGLQTNRKISKGGFKLVWGWLTAWSFLGHSYLQTYLNWANLFLSYVEQGKQNANMSVVGYILSDYSRSVYPGVYPYLYIKFPWFPHLEMEKKAIVFPWYLLMSVKLWVISPKTLVLKSDKATEHVNLLMLNYSFFVGTWFWLVLTSSHLFHSWYTLKRLSCHASAGPRSSQFVLVFAWGDPKTWHAIQRPKIWKAPNKRQHSPLIFIASCLSHHFQPPHVYSLCWLCSSNLTYPLVN
jgi:hypothetical protein